MLTTLLKETVWIRSSHFCPRFWKHFNLFKKPEFVSSGKKIKKCVCACRRTTHPKESNTFQAVFSTLCAVQLQPPLIAAQLQEATHAAANGSKCLQRKSDLCSLLGAILVLSALADLQQSSGRYLPGTIQTAKDTHTGNTVIAQETNWPQKAAPPPSAATVPLQKCALTRRGTIIEMGSIRLLAGISL